MLQTATATRAPSGTDSPARPLAASDLDLQRRLTAFNRERLRPRLPPDLDLADPELSLADELDLRALEERFIGGERAAIAAAAAAAPHDPERFVQWFEDLQQRGPGQSDPLFAWLAESATLPQMRWFLTQEVAGEAGFDDLVALTQLRFPAQPKLELARNYWDEMGRGKPVGMHGPMLDRLAHALELATTPAPIVAEALALGNLMVGFAANRRYAYHSIGALGVIELTAPARATCVNEGLRRLGVDTADRQYFALHATLDVQHSIAWNREVLRPLADAAPDPGVTRAIAEGALLRLTAGARCFARYRHELRLA